MHNIKVLIVEDDPNMGFIIQECFEERGFEAKLENNGKDGLDAFKKHKPDICVFDVMMPVKDGFTLAEEIRRFDKETPIIFLTAKGLKEDLLKGFSVGGDDYIKKPFSMEELIARVLAVLKRSKGMSSLGIESKEVYEIGKFVFDFKRQVLKNSLEEKKLTSKEAELLKMLCDNANSVLDRSATLKSLWEDDGFFQARSMDVYIAKLRKYLQDDPSVEIVNVRGQGFKLVC